jgi:hypothetical protein
LQILEDSGKYWLYQYCRYWKILENTGYTSIADTGRLATKLRYLSRASGKWVSVKTGIVHLQYWNTRIVDLCTIPEAPVFFIQQYW